jgi:hypothetical protein
MARRGIAYAAGGFLDVLEHRLHIGTPLSQIGVSYEARDNAAIRLAYIHDIGDVWVSLAPYRRAFYSPSRATRSYGGGYRCLDHWSHGPRDRGIAGRIDLAREDRLRTFGLAALGSNSRGCGAASQSGY